MATSVRREWASWFLQHLRQLSAAAGETPHDSLHLVSPQPINPGIQKPLIDSIGLGDMTNLPPIGTLETPGTPIAILPLQHIIRPSDLAVFGVSFDNLQLVYAPAGSPTASRLVILDPARPCFIQVRLPAQSIGEDTFPENSSTLPIPTRARTAGASNLVFRLPNAPLPIPFSLHGILDALRQAQLETRDEMTFPLSAGNLASEFGYPTTDFNLFSWLELPFRLILAPAKGTHWNTSSLSVQTPPAATTRAELWHGRFGKATGNSTTPANEDVPFNARAVWTPDIHMNASPIVGAALNTPLSADNRKQLVVLSSDKKLFPAPKSPTPVTLDRLTISALGAWLTAKWTFPNPNDLETLHSPFAPNGLSLSEWAHRSTLGRDQFVRVVNEGRLYPFGHRAAVVTISERKPTIVDSGAGDVVGSTAASLRTRQFIILREQDRDYTHRGLPLRHLHIKTLVTPDLAGTFDGWFWVQVPEKSVPGASPVDFRFEFVGTDWQQNIVTFTAPAIFAPFGVDTSTAAQTSYNNSVGTDNAPRRQTQLAGQRLAYAPGADANDLRTTLTSEAFNFLASNNATIQPPFLPHMERADVFIPAIEALKGERVSTAIQLHANFLSATTGIGNPADVFAQVLDSTPSLSVSKEQAGGLVAPSYAIEGLSREFGPVSDLANLIGGAGAGKGRFEVGKYLPNITLLGGITLQSILNALDFSGASSLKFTDGTPGAMMPGLTTSREGNALVTRFTWCVRQNETIEAGSPPFITIPDLFVPDANAEFKIATTIRQPLDGSAPMVEAIGSLTNFRILLIPGFQAVEIAFESVTFTSRTGSKVDVSVRLKEYKFVNDLAFVQDIMRYVPLDGFDDPPYLELVTGGLRVGFTFGIPTIGMGMFTMQDLSLGAGFYLPITSDEPTSLQLAINKREAPCVITVSGFGGGAFFAISLSLNGLQALEAALEFGAAVALSFGVASGAVTVMGGVYFSLRKDTSTGQEVNAVSFTAYIRIVGELDVLGLISISVEFYLGLTYNPTPKLLEGEASLTVKVKIAFFSKKVSISVHREIKGSDPTFVEMVTPTDWNQYLSAFAGGA